MVHPVCIRINDKLFFVARISSTFSGLVSDFWCLTWCAFVTDYQFEPSLDNGSYCPLYMRSMPGNVFNAQAIESGNLNLNLEILPSQNLGEKEIEEESVGRSIGGRIEIFNKQ